MIIYLSILLIHLVCIFICDIRGVRDYRALHIRLILVVLICISGFAYRLGGDGLMYLCINNMVKINYI